MSEIKDRHRCGGCKWWDEEKQEGRLPFVVWRGYNSEVVCSRDPDMEACSSWIPKRGWQE